MTAGRGSNTKPPLERIAVFGGNDHIGRPLRAANFERTLNAPTRLMFTIRAKSPSGTASPSRPMTFAGGPMPAQLTRMRAFPFTSSASIMAEATAASSVTLTVAKRPPIWSANAVPNSAFRSNRVTLAPRAASRSAVAAPRPEAPPVTIAATP